MEYWQPETDFYCGVDLHWTNMYACIVDRSGTKLVHRKLRNDPALFLRVLGPYLPSVTVATESTGSWYWLGDEAKVKSRRHVIPDRFLDDDVRLSGRRLTGAVMDELTMTPRSSGACVWCRGNRT